MHQIRITEEKFMEGIHVFYFLKTFICKFQRRKHFRVEHQSYVETKKLERN